MTRAKRKAKPAADFERKKAKLGRKTRPSNLTDTTVSKRQIHVPNQSRETVDTTGLPVTDLLSRARHHNANTRTASLNAISNALTDDSATAHTAINAPAPVIAAACQAFSDEAPTVRDAALQLLLRLVAVVDITPFRNTITSLLIAALTHIRVDIRIHLANALPRLVSAHPSILSYSPLEPLSDLLTASPTRAKSTALAAIACLFMKKPHEETQCTGRFYYNRPSPVSPDVEFIATLSESARSVLITRVAEAVQEHLHQPPRTISTSCAALAGVVSYGIPESARKAVERVLAVWRYRGDTHPLAIVALSAEKVDLAVGYVVKMLERDRYNDALDSVIQQCVPAPKVALAFGVRFKRAVDRGDSEFLRKCYKTAVVVMETHDATSLVQALPRAVELLQKGDRDIVNALIKAGCAAWKSGPRNFVLAEKLVDVCSLPLLSDVVDEIAGVAVCAGIGTGDVCAGMLGRCMREGRMEVVDTFVNMLEWLANENGKERLRAIALLRALKGVVRHNQSNFVNHDKAIGV